MIISELKLRQAIRNLLFEDSVTSGAHRPSTDDKAAGKFAIDTDEEVPLQPSELMPNQLAVEKPPIDDEDFIPANSGELSRAAAAMLDFVADDQIEFVFKNLQRLILKADPKASEIETMDPSLDDPDPLEAPINTGEENE